VPDKANIASHLN